MAPADVPGDHAPGGTRPFVIGVISDTHGVLDACAAHALTGVDHIVHAGDVCGGQVLAALRELAPVTAVRGNCDPESAGARLEKRVVTVLGGRRFVVAHKEKHATAGLDPALLDEAVVVVGHTHQPKVEWRGRTLWVNPGSATDPRYGSAASVALVAVEDGLVDARIVYL